MRLPGTLTLAPAFAALVFGAAVVAAPQTAAKDAKNTGLTTLRGCVASPNGKKAFTLADSTAGTTYSLKGLSVRDYVGRNVEVTGAPSKLRIVGGLYPNPNVAAQGGAYDPVKAAMAAQTPNQNPRPPVEFQVKSVRIVEGNCAK